MQRPMRITCDKNSFKSTKIIRLAGVLTQIADRLLQKKLDLTHAQASVLHVIYSKNKTSQTEIAQALALTTAAISRLIDILIEKGLVIREINPNSRRENSISLALSGKQKVLKVIELFKEAENQLYADIDSEEVFFHQIDNLMKRIRTIHPEV